ncbi:TlpA family protein disulfide reductase [Cohnella algarum]|uniref:TlpA family protein disulfide reductase n=1 Tax=Cohnella algarum TaxID=2044859 RepID=UPI001F073659|nr:TlpA disulfide reductase family protein [Cohnella algarum]
MILIVTAGLVLIAVMQSKGAYNEAAPKVGFKAPEFQLKGIDGRSYSLSALNGRPVLINFWASWCGPCREEAPDLVRLYAKYNDQIEFYGVNATSDDTLEGALSFVQQFQLSFPVLLDREGSVAKQYRIQGYPVTYFVDGKGKIVKIHQGIVSPESLEQTIVQTIRDSARDA